MRGVTGERSSHAVTQPEWVAPMLATLTEDRFSDPDWLYERKLDGERCLVFRTSGGVRLLSRNRKELNNHYPELVEALAEQANQDFVVDGEIVAFDGGRTSFSRLQGRMQVNDPDAARRTGVKVFLYVFDILHLDGDDLTGLPLRRRKALLRGALEYGGPLRFTPHRIGNGVAYWEDALPPGLGRSDRQAGCRNLYQRPLQGLAEVQVRHRAGVRDRRIHRSSRQPTRVRRTADRLLRER